MKELKGHNHPSTYTVYLVAKDLEFCETEKEVTEAIQDADLICNWGYLGRFEDDLKVGDELCVFGHIISDMSHLYGHLDLSDDAVRGLHKIWTKSEQWMAVLGDLSSEDMAHFDRN